MQFQYVLLAVLATTAQVLAVPAAEAKPAVEITTIAEGTLVTAATPKAEGEVVADACYACGYPCRGYYCCSPYPVCRYYKSPFQCVCANF